MRQLEELMYQVSDLFLAPVLILLVALFFYSLYQLGAFFMQGYQRKTGAGAFQSLIQDKLNGEASKLPSGFPLIALAWRKRSMSKDELDVAALGEVEGVRMVSRVAPMLGLVATMIPMGPALKSLSNGDVQGISENLIIAFAAVIFGLVIASITFFIASTKKKWLAEELVALAPILAQNKADASKDKEVSLEAA